MKNVRIPFITVSILVICNVAFSLFPIDWFYFSADLITQGRWWRLVSGHFIHADLNHLLWNCLGFAVLGCYLENISRRLLLASLLMGMFSVNLLLLSDFCQLDYYCGLSGILNTLLFTALWIYWKRTRSRTAIVVSILCFAKLLIELTMHESLLSDISLEPYTPSHLAGSVGGLVLILSGGKMISQKAERTDSGY